MKTLAVGTLEDTMTDPKTPGPWEIERPCGFPYTGIYIVSHSSNDKKEFHHFIAEVRQLRESGESLANAKYIVDSCNAAPAVAAELERVKGLLERVVSVHDDHQLIFNVIGECDDSYKLMDEIKSFLHPERSER